MYSIIVIWDLRNMIYESQRAQVYHEDMEYYSNSGNEKKVRVSAIAHLAIFGSRTPQQSMKMQRRASGFIRRRQLLPAEAVDAIVG